MPTSAAAPPKTKQVTITVSCDDHSVTFTVDPWVQYLDQGDEISWSLAAGSTTQDVTIGQTDGRWPFLDPRPVHSRAGSPGHARDMKPGLPHGDKYHYFIEAVCQSGTGPRIHAKIDPEMIIT